MTPNTLTQPLKPRELPGNRIRPSLPGRGTLDSRYVPFVPSPDTGQSSVVQALTNWLQIKDGRALTSFA